MEEEGGSRRRTRWVEEEGGGRRRTRWVGRGGWWQAENAVGGKNVRWVGPGREDVAALGEVCRLALAVARREPCCGNWHCNEAARQHGRI